MYGKKRKKTEEAEREEQREVRERHMVKVTDWVAAMICDTTKRVREWDMERKKAETVMSAVSVCLLNHANRDLSSKAARRTRLSML